MNTRIVLRQRPQGWVDEACFGDERVAGSAVGAAKVDDLLQRCAMPMSPPAWRCAA